MIDMARHHYLIMCFIVELFKYFHCIRHVIMRVRYRHPLGLVDLWEPVI